MTIAKAKLALVPNSSKSGDSNKGKVVVNPSDFFYPPVDDKGHSQRLYCNVPPYVARQLTVMLNNGFGFQSKEDVIRWAVVTGLKKLEEMEPEGQSFLSQAEAIMQTVKDEMYQGAYASIFDAMDKALELYRVAGDKKKMRRYLGKMREKIEGIADDFWRERAEKDFEERFGSQIVPGLGIKEGKGK